MASSSSANKVARVAARSGSGSAGKKQANWLFPAAIVAIVALGVAVVVYAMGQNEGSRDNSTPPRAQLSEGSAYDHWHAAFAINVCGKELPPQTDAVADVLGIHTHGDGLIHIHPFSTRAAGTGATMKRFFDQVGLDITDTGFSTGGQRYEAGETTCGGEPTELVMAHWEDATTAGSQPPDKIFTEDFPDVRLSEDLGAYTLALEPKGTDIPPPSASQEIQELGAADGGTTSSDAPEAGAEDPTATTAIEVPETPTDEGTETTVPAEESTETTEAPTTTAGG